MCGFAEILCVIAVFHDASARVCGVNGEGDESAPVQLDDDVTDGLTANTQLRGDARGAVLASGKAEKKH